MQVGVRNAYKTTVSQVKVQESNQPLGPVPVLRRTLVYLLLFTIGFAQPLLNLYGTNIAVFTTAGFEGAVVVWFGLVILMTPAVLLILIDLALCALMPRHENRVHQVLFGVALLFVFGSLLRSVSLGTLWLDIALILMCVIASVLLYARIGVMRTWLVAMSPLALAVFVIFVVSASSVIAPPSVGRASVGDTTGSGVRQDASVVWILLDEAPLWPLLSRDGSINASRFPGFAALAESSTWYRNAMTSAQLTVNAVPSILSGRDPVFDRQPVLADFPNNLFTAFNGIKRVDASEEVTALCPKNICVEPVGDEWQDVADAQIRPRAQRVGFFRFLQDALVVTGHKTLPRGLRSRLPAIDDAWGGFGAKSMSATPTGAVQGDAGVIERAQRLQSLIERATLSTKPTLHFTHVLLPHRPWALTPDLRVAPTPVPDNRPVSSTERKRDTYQSLLRQYVALDGIIADMVAKLRASDNWDRTMIVVTSDHGATFVPGESIRNSINAKNVGSLHDIYRVPLFIKYPDQKAPQTEDCAARTTDVLATVLAATGTKTAWKSKGNDLSSACPRSDFQTVWWPEGSTRLSTSFSSVLDRVAFYDTWVDANGDVASIVQSGRSGSLVGTTVPSPVAEVNGLTWTLDGADWYQSVGDKPFDMVPNRATGRLQTRQALSEDIDGLIVINGVVVGVVSELAGLRPSSNGSYFASVLLTEKIAPGNQTVELWTVNWSTQDPVFGRVGPPSK